MWAPALEQDFQFWQNHWAGQLQNCERQYTEVIERERERERENRKGTVERKYMEQMEKKIVVEEGQ